MKNESTTQIKYTHPCSKVEKSIGLKNGTRMLDGAQIDGRDLKLYLCEPKYEGYVLEGSDDPC